MNFEIPVKTVVNLRLKDLLRQKLVECGWRDEMKYHCREIIKSKGLENITVEELVAEIIPKGRETVPQNIKAELLTRIRKFLSTVTTTTNSPQNNPQVLQNNNSNPQTK